MQNDKNRKWWKKKKIIIPVVLLALLVGVRLVLEPVLLRIANEKAKEVNPEFKGHIGDLDLGITKGLVRLQDITASIKKNDREFLELDEVRVNLDWGKLFKEGDLSFAVTVHDFHLKFKDDILDAAKRLPEPEEKKKLPFEISKLVVKNSTVSFLDYPGLNPQDHLQMNNIYGHIRNINQEPGAPLATYDFRSTFIGLSEMTARGHIDSAADPVAWDMNGKLKDFKLKTMNDLLRENIPLTYKGGTLDVYSEVKSMDGKISGYVKPFMKNVQVMGNNKEFKNTQHFFVEILTAMSKRLLLNIKKSTVATRVPFVYEDGAFNVETGQAITKAVEHGFLETNKVERGIENKYSIRKPDPKEVQAQEEGLEKAKEKKKEEEKEEDK